VGDRILFRAGKKGADGRVEGVRGCCYFLKCFLFENIFK